MIVEYVLFKRPPGMTREQILEDSRTTIPRWRGNNCSARARPFIPGITTSLSSR